MLVILLLCACIALLYFYLRKCNNYWRERGVVTVKMNNFLSTQLAFLKGNSIEKVHADLYEAAPNEPYVGIYHGLKPILFVRDPELIHRITTKDFSHFHDRVGVSGLQGRLTYNILTLKGDDWKRLRNKLTSVFSSSKLKKMFGLIEECAKMLAERHLRPAIKTGEPTDVKDMAMRFSLDVIGMCTFGLQFSTLVESNSFFWKISQKMKHGRFEIYINIFLELIHPKLLKLFRRNLMSNEVENFFYGLLRDAEELRSKETKGRTDFLQLMLDLKDEAKNETDYIFTDEHIASNMFIFFTGGHETVAVTITFALYEMALQNEIQEKLRREIKKARDENNGVLDYETVLNMAYLDMVVSETLRLHNPSSVHSRFCTAAYKVPGSSLQIKAGEEVFFSVSAIHKDEKYHSDPLKFNPERFSKENIASMNSKTYMPFGSGPKICLGLRFAKLVTKFCLAFIISRYKLSRCEKTEVPIVLAARSVAHTPQNGVWLTVEPL